MPRLRTGAGELDRLFGALAGHGFSFQVNGEFAGQVTELTGRLFAPEQLYCGPGEIDDEVRVLISYGGDGTFLEAVRVLDLRPIPMIGINSGRLGFLANITMEGLDAALCDIRDGNYAVEERTLLSAEGDFIDRTCYPYAFNEVTIQRHDTSMIAAEVFVDGEMIATCHGDGMLVSTPSGSTAYSLSVGGPVVAPDCRCFIGFAHCSAQPDDASGGRSRYFAGYFSECIRAAKSSSSRSTTAIIWPETERS